MAQNITLLGANYQAVPAVELPKTGGGTASFTDVTDTTATAADVAAGTYFYTANGVRTAGEGSGSMQQVWYGTCSTAVSTVDKVVTCPGYTLQDGALIVVNCLTASEGNGTWSPLTLNINNTGLKHVHKDGYDIAAVDLLWQVYDVLTFMYIASADRYYFITRAKAVDVVQDLQSGTKIGSINGVDLYAPSGGGGSSNVVTLYSTIANGAAAYIDAAKTTTVASYYSYDTAAIRSFFENADGIKIVDTDHNMIIYATEYYWDGGDEEAELFVQYRSGNSFVMAKLYP